MNPVTEKIKMVCASKNIPAEELAANAGLAVEHSAAGELFEIYSLNV